MPAIRTKVVAWIVLGRFVDIDLDDDASDQPTDVEIQFADALALAISGEYTVAAVEAGSTRQIALILAHLVRQLADDEGDFEAMVADELVDIAQVFEVW